LVGSAGERIDEGGEMFNHLVVVRGVVGSDTKHLGRKRYVSFPLL